MDGDGDLDLASSFESDKVVWYKNVDGKASLWQENVVAINASDAWRIKAADIDGDGDYDLVVGKFDPKGIEWYENSDGNGTFKTGVVVTETKNIIGVAPVDLDGDGDIDLAGVAYTDNKCGMRILMGKVLMALKESLQRTFIDRGTLLQQTWITRGL